MHKYNFIYFMPKIVYSIQIKRSIPEISNLIPINCIQYTVYSMQHKTVSWKKTIDRNSLRRCKKGAKEVIVE